MYGNCNTAGVARDCGPASQSKYHGYAPWRGYYGGHYRRPKYNVPVNINNTEAAFEVHVYAVGFKKENIKISVVDDVLCISGTREVEKEPDFTRQEFPVRSFERTLGLNGQVDASKISARQEEGVLIVVLPKNEAAQSKTQEIEVN
jgi:HSP20 family protein